MVKNHVEVLVLSTMKLPKNVMEACTALIRKDDGEIAYFAVHLLIHTKL